MFLLAFVKGTIGFSTQVEIWDDGLDDLIKHWVQSVQQQFFVEKSKHKLFIYEI